MITTDINFFNENISAVYVNPYIVSPYESNQARTIANDKILVLGDSDMGNPLFPVYDDNKAIIRLFGILSTSTILKLTKTAVVITNNRAGIYQGATTYKNFDTLPNKADEVEILLTLTPSSQVEVEAIYTKATDTIQLSVLQGGVVIYSVKGMVDLISNMTDRKIMQIRVNRKDNDSIFASSFNHLNSFVNLTRNNGEIESKVIEEVSRPFAWNIAYAVVSSDMDKNAIKALNNIAYRNLIQVIYDLNFTNIIEAIEYKESLEIKASTVWLLNRSSQNGYSLDYTNKLLARDNSSSGRIKQKALYAIMGIQQPIENIEEGDFLYFSDADIVSLANAKIIPILNRDGINIYGDVFGDDENIDLYIDKKLAKILDSEIGRNPTIAFSNVVENSNRFISDCASNHFFKDGYLEPRIEVIDGKICTFFNGEKIEFYRRGEVITD